MTEYLEPNLARVLVIHRGQDTNAPFRSSEVFPEENDSSLIPFIGLGQRKGQDG